MGVTVIGVLEVLNGFSYLLSGDYFALLSIVPFVLAYGLFTGRGWAWTVTLIFQVLDAVVNLVDVLASPIGIVFLAIDVIVIYYLTRPNVKAYFRKSAATL